MDELVLVEQKQIGEKPWSKQETSKDRTGDKNGMWAQTDDNCAVWERQSKRDVVLFLKAANGSLAEASLIALCSWLSAWQTPTH